MISIRLLTLDDLDIYYRMIDESRESLFMMPSIYSTTMDIASLRLEKSPNSVVYGIFLDEQLIGSIELNDEKLQIDGHHLAYFIVGPHRTRGYMKEALSQVTILHKDEYPFYADVLEDNAPSLWMLWGFGFKEDYRWKPYLESSTYVRLVYKQ